MLFQSWNWIFANLGKCFYFLIIPNCKGFVIAFLFWLFRLSSKFLKLFFYFCTFQFFLVFNLHPTFKSFLLIVLFLFSEYCIKIFVSNARQVLTELKSLISTFFFNSPTVLPFVGIITLLWILWIQPLKVLVEIHLFRLNLYF